MPNQGQLKKDGFFANLFIKGKQVLDKNRNAKVKTLNVNGNANVKGILKVGPVQPYKDIEASLDLLYNAFQAVDAGFNDPNKLGLTAPEIVALGYFDDNSSVIALGPFTPGDPTIHPGQHTDHPNQPGAFQAVGALNCAGLQVSFEGGLLADPNFPYMANIDAPTLYHSRPVNRGFLGNDHFLVTADAAVTYGPNGVNGTQVGLVQSHAVYRLECDVNNNLKIPVVVRIDFSIVYQD